MLIVGRRAGQRILIGKDIAITVLEVRGNTVRVGVDAPAHLSVDREEIRKLKEQQREQVPTGRDV